MPEVHVKEVPEMTVMSLPFTGSYDQTQTKLDRLMSWLLRVGHPYSSPPMGIYHDDPAQVPEEELRAEVCLPIEEECEGEEDVVRKELPAVTVAYAVHKGPYHQIPPIYEDIFEWMEENGYEYVEDMPTREVFLKLYGQVEEPEEYVTEVQVPVQPVGAAGEESEPREEGEEPEEEAPEPEQPAEPEEPEADEPAEEEEPEEEVEEE